MSGVARGSAPEAARGVGLVDHFQAGLDAPICLTWELTYACNLACVHCLSSSGRRDPRELSSEECRAVIDELEAMGVFYVNIGGGEPTVRRDFWELLGYATAHHVGVKFSTNGSRITPEIAARLAGEEYVDVQISLDGASAGVNDRVRGVGSYATALRAMGHLRDAGLRDFKLSVVLTRENAGELDAFQAIAEEHGAQLRITRLRPSGRGADVWDELHPTAEQQRAVYDWLLAHGEGVLTGDSFFHLSAYGQALPGLGMCGAGRVVCLIDPVGDVYACPFAIHDAFLAGNLRAPGGFARVWRESELFGRLRGPQSGGACESCGFYDSCRGGCMAAKFFTGLPLEGPDPECVLGHGQALLAGRDGERAAPRPGQDHSRPRPRDREHSPVHPPAHACQESPLVVWRR
jgi:mycofactocin radical SAM maturase